MKPSSNSQQYEDDGKELFKLCGKKTFISEPRKYILVFLLFQAGMLIYFIVTIKQSSLALRIATIVCYIFITLIELFFPFIDPGIIPKIYPREQEQQIPIDMAVFNDGREGLIYKEYSFVVKTHSFWSKYCGNCSIYRPPRTIHCYACQVCIEKLDHHCPWLGACIGKRNYYVYLMYIGFMGAILGLLCFQTIYFISNQGFMDGIVEYLFNILLGKNVIIRVILCIPSGLFVLILIMLHIKLSKENMTTNELWHEKWNTTSGNPFQKTFFLKNCIAIIGNAYRSKAYIATTQPLQGSSKQQTETVNNFENKPNENQISLNPVNNCSQLLQPIGGLEIILMLHDQPER